MTQVEDLLKSHPLFKYQHILLVDQNI